MKSAAEFIKEKGYAFVPSFDGYMTKFDRLKTMTGWHAGYIIPFNGKQVQVLSFGDFASKEKWTWVGAEGVSEADQAELQLAVEASRKERANAVHLKHKRAQADVKLLWGALDLPGDTTPYSHRKGLLDLYGAKNPEASIQLPYVVPLGPVRCKDGIVRDLDYRVEQGDLLVPMRDTFGELWNFQRIAAVKDDPRGEKRPYPGGKITGLFHTIGELNEGTRRVYITEGYATGCSVWEALEFLRLQRDGQAVELRSGSEQPMSSADRDKFAYLDTLRTIETFRSLSKPAQADDARLLGRGDAGVGQERGSGEDGAGREKANYSCAAAPSEESGREELSAQHERARPDHRAGQNGLAGQTRQGPGPGAGGQGLGLDAGPVRNRFRVGSLDSSQPLGLEEIQQMGRAQRVGRPTDRAGGDEVSEPRAVGPGLAQNAGNREEQGQLSPQRSRGLAHGDRQGVHDGAQSAQEQTRPHARGDTHASTGGSDRTGEPPGSARRGELERLEGPPPSTLRGGDSTAVVVAFNAGNLKPVAQALRRTFPNIEIIIAGDDDAWTDALPGAVDNPGIEAAKEAARVVGGHAIFPRFDGLADLHRLRPTDFNDMVHLLGLPLVADCIKQGAMTANPWSGNAPVVLLKGEKSPPGAKDQPAFENLCTTGKNGATHTPSPQIVVEQLLNAYGDSMVKQDKDLFRYTGTHWEHLGQHDIDVLMQQAQVICGGELGADSLRNVVELFRVHLNGVPPGRDLFTPNPMAANFENGTLHAVRGPTGYSLEFRGHDRADFIVNVLPFAYSERLERNDEFEAMLDRVFKGDSDADEKRRAVGQMFGACLMPISPHLFMLYGPPGTGKSTVMKLAIRLVGKDNLCSVEPSEFKGFGLESMAGKLVNYDTDIDVTQPIKDSVVKKIQDRVPVRIQRKNQKDLYAPLPATHLLGGNKIPPTLEGVSRAHDRRWTFLGFNCVLTHAADYDIEYAEKCFDQGAEGILAFALAGLRDLLESNLHFLNPTSGKEKMEEWQKDNDPVSRFFDDVDSGEVLDGQTRLIKVKEGRIERPRLYNLYSEWAMKVSGARFVLANHKFYRRVEELGFKSGRTSTTRFFEGLNVGSGPGAKF